MYSSFLERSAAIAMIIGLGACGQMHEDAALGASPSINTAVGPIPGPHSAPQTVDNPYAHDPAALAQGRQLFVSFNCSGCHGGHAGGGMGPSLRDEDWIYGNSSTNIFDSIASGRANGMPAWGTRLPAQSIWLLTAYIQSLRTPSEPSPPS
jgi:cytochrome c oxidase cbb3-type subunit III